MAAETAVAEVRIRPLEPTLEDASHRQAEPNSFIEDGVCLRPFACALSSAGRHPTQVGSGRSSGAWRGSLSGGDAIAAASRLVPLLAGIVQLDGCGTLAEASLSASSLQFVKPAQWEEEDEANAKAEEILAGAASKLKLVGQCGQILTHSVKLWLTRHSGNEFDALLVLQPLQRHSAKAPSTSFHIARPSPMGLVTQRWEEVALIELPRLLRLTMDASADRRTAAMSQSEPKFLVDEEEEIVKISCWQRTEGVPAKPASGEAVSIEQLLWYSIVASLSETSPCAEAAVPMQRVELSDEGIATREELLGEVPEHDVPKEDAPRLASLVFLRQFVNQEVIEEEVLPRLLPASGSLRIFSAQLIAIASQPAIGQFASQNKPKSLDDLFSDDLDFRAPSPWASQGKDEDPLRHHELTSVFLVNESGGFALCFHCLQGVDPLS